MTPTFTPKQARDFRAYVRVQKSGRYNMLDPQARKATGLSQEEFVFVLNNYGELSNFVAVRNARPHR